MAGPGAGRTRQRGQILVVVAGGMIGLLAIAALVFEGGTLVLNRRDAQNASDLASLAGAKVVADELTDPDANLRRRDVFNAIRDSLEVNHCEAGVGTRCTWTANFVSAGIGPGSAVSSSGSSIPSGTIGVRVRVTREPGTILGRIFNMRTWEVSTEGTAVAAKPTSIPTSVVLPIAVCGWTDGEEDDDDDDERFDCARASRSDDNHVGFVPGQIYDLADTKDAPGGFGWLSWDGSSSSGVLAARICSPQNPSFTLDDPYDSPTGGGETWFPADPGTSNSSSIRACLQRWIDSQATVLLPIYDVVTGGGTGARYHLTGVAAFIIVSQGQPAIDSIQGYFVEYYNFTDVTGGPGTLPPGPGDISYALSLVR